MLAITLPGKHPFLHLYVASPDAFHERLSLAIYHFTVSVLSRARGHRIVASAAAQAAARLRDDYYGIVHNHARRPGVEFSEILAAGDAHPWVFDREQLWNRVEAAERRKDAQLARKLEMSLPVELSQEQRIQLLRDFIRMQFVAQGMIADVGIRRTKLDNPNAHVLLTLRAATATGFGPKMRQWNGKANLLSWRAAWANEANFHLARAGHRLRIDHRTLEAQHIELTPSRKTGGARPLHEAGALPDHLQARFAEQRRIAQSNGASIIEDPTIAIRALAHQRHGFTLAELGQFLLSRTDGDVQHAAALAAIKASSELVISNASDDSPTRYTSRDLIEAEKSLLRRARTLAQRQFASTAHAEPHAALMPALPPMWSQTLREAYAHIASAGDFKAAALTVNETGLLLPVMRAHWSARGTGVFEDVPRAHEEALGRGDVIIMRGAEMLDLKSLERVLAAAERASAKLVLLADAVHLKAMGSLSAMHALMAANRNLKTS